MFTLQFAMIRQQFLGEYAKHMTHTLMINLSKRHKISAMGHGILLICFLRKYLGLAWQNRRPKQNKSQLI